MIDQDYDALIVGARVAGATLAILLGDAGYRVLLVDRATFPSATLSTHYFRGGRGVTVLKQVGVLDDVLARGCPPLICQYNYANGRAEPVVNPAQSPGEIDYCLSVRRETLDYLLVERARRCPSITVLEKTQVTDVLRDHGRVVGARLATPEGKREVWAGIPSVRMVVAPPSPARWRRPTRSPTKPAGRSTIATCAVSPAPAGKPPMARSSRASRMKSPTSSRAMTGWPAWPSRSTCRPSAGCASNHGSGSSSGSRRIADWRVGSPPRHGKDDCSGCGPERNYVRIPAGPGWALVGDAGMHQDPWSGTGIDKATMHATFLADALAQWFTGGMSEHDALASYHVRRNEDGLASYRQTVALAKDLRQLSAG